jgi:hypothetical protein
MRDLAPNIVREGTVALSDQAYKVPTSKAGRRRGLHWFACTRTPIFRACCRCQPEWDRLMQRTSQVSKCHAAALWWCAQAVVSS